MGGRISTPILTFRSPSCASSLISRYQDFTSGYFDVVIADECHRSIYGAWQSTQARPSPRKPRCDLEPARAGTRAKPSQPTQRIMKMVSKKSMIGIYSKQK